MSHTDEGLYPADHTLRIERVDQRTGNETGLGGMRAVDSVSSTPYVTEDPPQRGTMQPSQTVQSNMSSSLVVTRCKVRSYVNGVSSVNPR